MYIRSLHANHYNMIKTNHKSQDIKDTLPLSEFEIRYDHMKNQTSCREFERLKQNCCFLREREREEKRVFHLKKLKNVEI